MFFFDLKLKEEYLPRNINFLLLKFEFRLFKEQKSRIFQFKNSNCEQKMNKWKKLDLKLKNS